jgi:head-tail adaptor
MNPGRLDRLAQFFALREEVSPGSAPRRFFENPVALWLALEKEKTSARLPADEAGGPRSATDTRFIARFSEAITPGSRLTVEGKTYEVKGVAEAPGPRRAYLTLTCRATTGTKPVAP